jgi:hypothetical protein
MDQVVTTVTCLKHPWSVRLYDQGNMKFVSAGEEREINRQIQAATYPQLGKRRASLRSLLFPAM